MASFARFMGSIMRPAGQGLEGVEMAKFTALKNKYESCVNSMLIRPNWEAFLVIGEMLLACTPRVVSEFIYHMRQHLDQSKSAGVMLLLLHLVDFLVKNGNPRLWRAFNNDNGEFMNALSRSVRKFAASPSSESRPTADLGLDIIQAWGEGFLTYSKSYPHMIRIYHEMRKDGIRFKAQYDPSRVPIFTATSGSDMSSSDAVLEASLSGGGGGGGEGGGGGRTSSSSGGRKSAGGADGAMGGVAGHLVSTLGLITELMGASASATDFNDIVGDMVQMMTTQHNELVATIENGLDGDPAVTERLFAVHERVTDTLDLVAKIKDGTMRLADAQRKMAAAAAPEPAAATAADNSKPSLDTSGDGSMDLLGLNSPTTQSAFAGSGSGSGSGSASTSSTAPAAVGGGEFPDLFGTPVVPPVSVAPVAAAAAVAATAEDSGAIRVQLSSPKPIPKLNKPIPKLMRPPSDRGLKLAPPPQTAAAGPAAPAVSDMFDLLSMAPPAAAPAPAPMRAAPAMSMPVPVPVPVPMAVASPLNLMPASPVPPMAPPQQQQQQSSNPFDLF